MLPFVDYLEFEVLDNNLLYVNSPEIPEDIQEMFWEVKNSIGSLPMGIAYVPEKGWFVVDTMGTIYAKKLK